MRTQQVSGFDRTDTTDPYGHPVLVDETSTAAVDYPSGAGTWRVLTLLAGVVGGAVLVIMGVLALVRGDVNGSWNEPIVMVNGWPHSPMLGLLEVIAGALLILVSLSSAGEFVVGAVIAGFGIVALLEPQVLDDALSIDPSHAWLMVAIGLVAVLSSTIAHFARRTVRVVHTTSIAPYSRVEEYREEYIDEPPFR
jgi:hypothetical protein